MAVRFDFVVSDIDAENLMSVLRSASVRTLCDARTAIVNGMMAEADWHNRHADYLDGLREKIASSSVRVED